ncbi:MAG: sulfite exporter TauE/SafE family protein [Clostridia bacterium]|nr:sulfite exporter TauE/SafE family protein [Clostridia bacterium]
MTCINCQKKIYKALSALPGVSEISVSYERGTAQLSFDPGITNVDRIGKTIADLGYDLLPDGQMDISKTICLPVIIIALYILLEHFGVLNLLVPSQLAESGMGYGMLFVVGLFTSVHCIAMCGGINLSQSLPGGRQQGNAFLPSLLYNAGRVVSYTVVGFLLGLVGMLVGGNSSGGVPVLLQGILKLLAGALMVVMGVNMLGIFPWLRKLNPRMPGFIARRIGAGKAAARRPFIIGLLNGLMPCGPLQSMQILALASGNPLTGALSMLLFSLGTVPLMLGLGALVSALGKRFARAVMNTGAVLVAVLGLSMLAQGGSLSGMLLPDKLLFLVIALFAAGIAASIPFRRKAYRIAGVAAALVLAVSAGAALQQLENAPQAQDSRVQVVDGVQQVRSTLQPGQYPTIMVQAGMPVKWNIDAPSGSINGCNYRLFIPEDGIDYAFSEGENIIEFTPEAPGDYAYTCWMGMIRGNIIVM